MSLHGTKRGDRIFVVRRGHRAGDPVSTEWLEVTSAGPKYVTAGEGYKRERFHRDSGAVVTDYAPRIHAYTTELEWAEERRVTDLRQRCSRAINSARINSMDAESLERLLAIFGEEA